MGRLSEKRLEELRKKALYTDWQLLIDHIDDLQVEIEKRDIVGRELAELLSDSLALKPRAEGINDPQVDEYVKNLCEKIGYGRVMDSSARLWFKKDSSGCITTGHCFGTIERVIEKALKLWGKSLKLRPLISKQFTDVI